MTPHIQSKQVEPPRDADSRERSWLVFRLGPHVMCASALDVEGIIERPRVITTLPVMPEYALGAFLFRDHSATAISLRRKLKVREGEDSAKGPFIAARIRDAIVAFWVDEVKDVIEEKDTEWRPMPEMLAGGLFDRFAIREGELILHTSFAALLEAEVEIQSVARWAASQIDSGVTPVPTSEARTAAPDKTPQTVETSARDVTVGREAGPGAQGRDEAADSPRDTLEGSAAAEGATIPPRGAGTDSGATPTAAEAKARATAANVPGGSDVHEVGRSTPVREVPFQSTAVDAAGDVGIPIHSEVTAPPDKETPPYQHAYSGPTGTVSVPLRSGTRPGVTGNTAPEDLSTVTSRSIYEVDRRPPSSTRYWLGVGALAIAVLAAMLYAFSPGFLGDARQPAASTPPATSTARDTAPQAPVAATAAHAARDAATRAVASPKAEPAPQQIVSIKSGALTLTVERPAGKDARPAAKPAAAASGVAERPADPNTRTHVVVRGDTLWDIAKKHVGDPYRYPELAEFSNIRNPDLIYPGDIVRIEIRANRK